MLGQEYRTDCVQEKMMIPTETDKELNAMSTIAAQLQPLTQQQKLRILEWVVAKFLSNDVANASIQFTQKS